MSAKYVELDGRYDRGALWRRSIALLLVAASVAAVARRERYVAGGELELGSDAAAERSQRDDAASADAETARPHIVVSLIDDMGWADAPWSAVLGASRPGR